MHRRRLLPLYKLQVFERYAFYGFKSIMLIFMLNYLKIEKKSAISISHGLFSFASMLPFLISFFSDVIFGRYRTIVFGIPLYAISAGVLSFFVDNKDVFFICVIFILIGNGIIKSTLPSFIVDQNKQSGDYDNKIVGSFVKHTFAANFGMFLGMFTIPIILKEFGAVAVFRCMSICLMISACLFVLSKRKYVKIPRKTSGEFLKFFTSIPFFSLKSKSWFGVLKFLMLTGVFFFILEQKYSLWIMQGALMNKNIFGYELPPNVMLVFMPGFSLFVIFLYDRCIFNILSKFGIKSLTHRVWFGMTLGCLCPLSVACIQYFLNIGYNLHILWQLIPYFLLVIADVCVYLSGIQYMYTQISRDYRTIMGSLWFFVITFGNFYVMVVTSLFPPIGNEVSFFMLSAMLLLIASIVFRKVVVSEN